MISVLIADDHKMFREGLVSLLSDEKGLRFIGEASNGKQAIKMMELEKPDVVLLDVEMPDQDGLETLVEMKRLNIKTKALVLTMYKSPQFIKNILKAGAAGYLQKDAGKSKLIEAIQTVHETGTFFSEEASRLLIDSMREEETASSISPRELEIIRLISEQLTTGEIADSLSISKHTVESHRQNILLKLGLKNSAGLVKYAVQNGLI